MEGSNNLYSAILNFFSLYKYMHFENKRIKIKYFTNLIILILLGGFAIVFSKFGEIFPSMKLYIVALFRFKENYLMDGIELMKKLVSKTRQEEGCLQYDLVEDISEKGVFFITELWESQEHHFRHSQSEHLADFHIYSAPMLDARTQVYKGFRTF